MRYLVASTAVLALLPSIVYGAPSLYRRQSPSINDLVNAKNNWVQDTGVVSQFLTDAASLSGNDLVTAAVIALNAEKDELNHKQVLDKIFLDSPTPDVFIQQADSVLVGQNKFQDVVDGLQNLVNNGASMSADQVSQAISDINNGRCSSVLPAIDVYAQAVSTVDSNGGPNAAIRPINC